MNMVIGSSNVGKSMYCRLLLNSYLNTCSQVIFLDMDIGQNEFSTEGVLSLNIVNKPQFRTSCVPHIDNHAM